jgi:aminoglycoside phosphotransferase (APT) family kinase protein
VLDVEMNQMGTGTHTRFTYDGLTSVLNVVDSARLHLGDPSYDVNVTIFSRGE